MTSPILVGVLYDFPQVDGGKSFEEALRLGLDDVGGVDRPVEFVSRQAAGLPGGTAHDVEAKLAELVAAGVVVVVGPSISDNGLVVRDLIAFDGPAAINYTGGERTRNDWMFHYQVGSLAEEPVVLAQHLASLGRLAVAVVHDRSPVGRGYADAFDAAASQWGLEIVGRAAVPPLAEDVTPVLQRFARARPDGLVYLGLGVAARGVAVSLGPAGLDVPVVANSALMFGYARKDWRSGWEGWTYIDTVSDSNEERQRLAATSRQSAAGPVGVAAYDIGRLLGHALVRTDHLTKEGVRDGLEQVKRLPAASGYAGTMMGFGPWDHGALKGGYLVLRQWRDGKTVEL